MTRSLTPPFSPKNESGIAKALLHIFSLFLIMGLGCKSEDPEEKFTRLMSKAEEYREAGKYEEARISLQSATQLKPENAQVYFELADVLARQKQIGKAVLNYQYTINLDPSHKDARRRLAALYIVGGKAEDAEGHIRKLLELDPGDKDALILDASLASKRKDFDKAREVYERILTMEKNNPSALAGLADLALADGDLKKAEELLRKALQSDPDNNPIQLALINMYSTQGRLDEAEKLLESLVKENPSNSGLRFFFGEFLLSAGARDRAQTEYEAALEHDPLRHIARDRLYDIHLANRTPEKAAELTSQLESLYPEEPAVTYFKARGVELERKPEEALEMYLSLTGKLRSFSPVFRRAGLIEMGLGKISESLEHLNQAIAIDPFDIGARIALARYFLKQQDYSQAKEHITRVLAKFPRQVAANILRADVAKEEGDFETAERVYRLMVKAFPNSPVGYLRLASLAEETKKVDLAIELYRQALSYDVGVFTPAKRFTALMLAQQGPEATTAELRKMIEQSKQSKGELKVVLATLLMTTPGSDIEEARSLLQAAIDDKPNFLPAYSLLARLDAAQGRNEEAIENYKKLIAQKPDHLPTRLLYAITLERTGNLQEAADEYEAILKMSSRFAAAANNLAWLLADQLDGDLNRALDLARLAKEELPKESAVADTLGWVYYKRGAHRAALPLIEEAIELDKERGRTNPEIVYHLALVKNALGDEQGAKEAAEIALKGMNPKHPEYEAVKKLTE